MNKKSLFFMFFLVLFNISGIVYAQNYSLNKLNEDLDLLSNKKKESDFDWTKGLKIVDGTVFKVPLDKYDIKVFLGNPITTVKKGVRHLGGEGGINGSFFCPAEKSYSWCGGDNSTVSDRIVDGKDFSKYKGDTGIRGIFGFNKQGKPLFVQKNLGYVEGYRKNTNEDKIGDIYNGIGNRPILLDEGYNPLIFYGDQIKYAKNLKKMTRNFICSTKDGNTIYMGFVRNKTIFEMPDYLEKKYGCYFALNLDAGKSSAMVYHDTYLIGPGRNIVDGFVVVPKDFWLNQELENYKLNDKEKLKVLLLYKIFNKKIKEKGKKFKGTILTALTLFDKKKSIRGNIPLRIQFRILKGLIEKL